MFLFFKSSFILQLVLTIFVSIFVITIMSKNQNISFTFKSSNICLNANNSFSWPTPNYKQISSYFGYRKSPTQGASSYHSGIDILAPQGTNIQAIANGYVSFVGFDGGNGYCVKLTHDNNYSSTYAHISPNFLVEKGDIIKKGTTIAKVGPKYIDTNIYGYTDGTGKYTNGATTGPHLHLAISKDGKRINPSSVL